MNTSARWVVDSATFSTENRLQDNLPIKEWFQLCNEETVSEQKPELLPLQEVNLSVSCSVAGGVAMKNSAAREER
jgi:hypothetical protein